MDYDFTSRERDFGRVVLAVTLDKKRMAERIIIGRTDEVRRQLDGKSGEVYYDETRPLGSLLLTLEGDKKNAWNEQGAVLRESFDNEYGRWEMTAPVSDYLRGKYETGEPSAMFAAIRTWDDYLNCYYMNHGDNILTDKLFMLYRPFDIYANNKPWKLNAASAVMTDAVRDGESGVELWYPMAKRPFETVVAGSSLLPIISYYLHRIEEWRYVFQRCKVCKTFFLARSRHYELCSAQCRKVQAVEAKREYDERVKGDELEKKYEATYHYWYNQQRRLKKNADPERLAAFDIAFRAFRKEAVRRKGLVKREKAKLEDFKNWLFVQQGEVDRLMGKLMQR
jgi:hypothetical protein